MSFSYDKINVTILSTSQQKIALFFMNVNDQDKQGQIICDCTGTTHGQVLSLIAQGFDLEKISSATGATTGCGACDAEIMTLMVEQTKTI